MVNGLHVIGTNFKITALERVARVNWDRPEMITRFLKDARTKFGFEEIFFLQTCNRREFYFYRPESEDNSAALATLKARFLQAVAHSMDKELDEGDFYHHVQSEAAVHLFRVASSLDSMVLGETEIIKQLKDQSNASAEHGHVGQRLRGLIEIALRVSKRVRHQTQITKNVVSMASLVFRKTCEHVRKKARKRMVFVGAGHFITSLLPTFTKTPQLELIFVNRTLPTQLADTFGGTAMTLDEFLTNPPRFEALISATSSPGVLFDRSWFRRHQPDALVMDAALPRDVSADVVELPQITFMDLEHMELILTENRAAREAEIPKAQPIFSKGLEKLDQRWLELDLAVYNQQISSHFRSTGERAFQHLLKETLPDLSIEEAERLRLWTEGLVNKLTKVPILGLKGVASEFGNEAVEAYTRTVASRSNLFK